MVSPASRAPVASYLDAHANSPNPSRAASRRRGPSRGANHDRRRDHPSPRVGVRRTRHVPNDGANRTVGRPRGQCRRAPLRPGRRAGHGLRPSRARRTADERQTDRLSFVRRATRRLGPEGYRLDVHTRRRSRSRPSRRRARSTLTQSLRQLLPPEIFRDAPIAGTTWTIPAVTIVDRPRFAWRGMHLDVSRHFMPKEFVKKYIDLLALHKMNSFHWHLTDDQGWRIEIKKYPRLTAVGAWRIADARRHRPQRDSTLDVYDQQAARRLLHAGRRARDRRVRARAIRAHRPRDRNAGSLAGRDRRLPEPRQLRRHGSRVDALGRHATHPESVRHDHRVHAGRAHRGDGALSRRVHPHRRRRSDQAGVEGEPARASEDQSARHFPRRPGESA